MATLIVTGVPPYDGEYPLNISKFTNGELRTIKQISGVTAGNIKNAITNGDNDLVVAITAIVLERAGHTVVVDALWAADSDSIDFRKDAEDDEVEPRPPASASQNGDASLPDASEKPNENKISSGESSEHDSE